jgi:NAD(P)H-hydrate epimerase
MKVLTAAQMREADRLTTEQYGIPGIELMENAGTAIAEFLQEKFADLRSRKILVLCQAAEKFGLPCRCFSVCESGICRG